MDTTTLAAVIAATVGTIGLFYAMGQWSSSERLEEDTIKLGRLLERVTEQMESQTELMLRQTRIIERQDEILSRRVELIVVVRPQAPELPDSRICEMRVRNRGPKTAIWYTYHLYVPIEVRGYTMVNGRRRRERIGIRVERTDSQRWYMRYSGHVLTAPLIQGRSAIVARIEVPRQRIFSLGWQAVSDERKFPEDTEYGDIEIVTQ